MVRNSGILGRSPLWKKVFIVGIGLELVAFLGCYAMFTRLNIDRDLRLYMHNEYPTILDNYYKIHEMSNNKIREKDMFIWKTQGKVL